MSSSFAFYGFTRCVSRTGMLWPVDLRKKLIHEEYHLKKQIDKQSRGVGQSPENRQSPQNSLKSLF
jgi:hypothetical protein